jgi:hypothetical protein
MYRAYFERILHHKWLVLLECHKAGILYRGIWHDMSKFRLDEFCIYAKRFHWVYCEDYDVIEEFEVAEALHKSRNMHHPEYWIRDGEPTEMDHDSVLELLCDWRAMERRQPGVASTAEEYYLGKRHRMVLHPSTRALIEQELGLEPDSDQNAPS